MCVIQKIKVKHNSLTMITRNTLHIQHHESTVLPREGSSNKRLQRGFERHFGFPARCQVGTLSFCQARYAA